MAAAVVAIESNPHTPRLSRNGTVFLMLECIAEHNLHVPEALKDLLEKAREDDDALDQLTELLLSLHPLFGAFLSTTQAVTLIDGGVKVNALPERAEAVVNHRIAEQR